MVHFGALCPDCHRGASTTASTADARIWNAMKLTELGALGLTVSKTHGRRTTRFRFQSDRFDRLVAVIGDVPRSAMAARRAHLVSLFAFHRVD